MSGVSGRDDAAAADAAASDAAGDAASDTVGDASSGTAGDASGAGNTPVTESADSAESKPAQGSDDDDALVRDFELLRDDGSDDGFDSSSDMD